MRTQFNVHVNHGNKQNKCLFKSGTFVLAAITAAQVALPVLPVYANALTAASTATAASPAASASSAVSLSASTSSALTAVKGNTKGSANGTAFLNRAIHLYQQNSFKESELYFRQAIAENPSNVDAHYYLANALVHLNRHDEAIEEFKRTYRLDPFGPTSGYCRKALKAYADKQAADKTADDDGGGEILDATSSLMHYAQKESGKSASDAKLVNLRAQAEREKIRHQQAADSYGRAMRSTGDGEALTIRQNARDDIDRILHGTRGGLPWVQQAAEARAAEVQHNADELERIARERAGEKAAEYKSVSKAKGKSLDETVNNLEHQLITKTLPGTPSLKHDGTDLFVRSYSPSTQKSPYPDAHAAVARINPVHVDHSKDDGDDTSSTGSTTKVVPVHTVKGEVLN
jgi:tetratricopeptide (TPR) repeat protein